MLKKRSQRTRSHHDDEFQRDQLVYLREEGGAAKVSGALFQAGHDRRLRGGQVVPPGEAARPDLDQLVHLDHRGRRQDARGQHQREGFQTPGQN